MLLGMGGVTMWGRWGAMGIFQRKSTVSGRLSYKEWLTAAHELHQGRTGLVLRVMPINQHDTHEYESRDDVVSTLANRFYVCECAVGPSLALWTLADYGLANGHIRRKLAEDVQIFNYVVVDMYEDRRKYFAEMLDDPSGGHAGQSMAQAEVQLIPEFDAFWAVEREKRFPDVPSMAESIRKTMADFQLGTGIFVSPDAAEERLQRRVIEGDIFYRP